MRGCQMPQDAAEHVRTREAEAPPRLTDTTLTSDGNKQHKRIHNNAHTETDVNTQGIGDI